MGFSKTYLVIVSGIFIVVNGNNQPTEFMTKVTEPLGKLLNVDWKNKAQDVGTILKDQVNSFKDVDWKKPAHQMKEVTSTITEKVMNIVIDEVRAADIRLLKKVPDRSPDIDPLLDSADIDEPRAKQLFETEWLKFYTWSSDMDTVYKPVYDADCLFSDPHYHSSLDTIFILHDQCSSGRDHSVLKIVEALKLRNYDANYNIMIMDFQKFMCSSMTPDSSLNRLGFNPQVMFLSNAIGEFIHRGIEQRKVRARQINILGLGVGTHLAALVARYVKEVSRKRLNSILGLDPPVRLRKSIFNKRFARTIHIYHTFKLVPGVDPSVGRATADFVFGGAKRGPQCKKSTITVSCYKGFGVQLFVATLLYPKLFAGRSCPSYSLFFDHFCDGNEYTYVSFPPDKKANGVYHMGIDYDFPYGQGFDGIYEVEDENVSSGSVDVAKLSPQEYYHRLEIAVSEMRSEVMACVKGVLNPRKIIRCVMTVQPQVRKLVKQRLIKKINCEPSGDSPTGKKCNYETRTNNKFSLPF